MATAVRTRPFRYDAVDAAGTRRKGTIEAASEQAAATSLRKQGLVPVAVARAGVGLNREIHVPGIGDRVKTKDLAIFARQFATLTAAGLPLLRCLAILEEQTPKPKLNAAIRRILRDVQAGAALSGAMAEHDTVFPRMMVALIRAGETGGFLDGALDRIAVTLEKDAQLRARVVAALTYPAIVVAFSILMTVGVLIFIVPIFERMFSELGGTLPLPTRILVAVSDRMVWIGPVAIAIVIVCVAVHRHQTRHNARWRLTVDRFKLCVPVFGPLMTKVAVSRFARNFGTLLAAGVPLMQALDVVGETTGNAVISEVMHDVARGVRDGKPISVPLAAHDVFPPMVTHMVEVGEETGQLSAMLDKVAEFYDHEVAVATESLTAALEPVMVIVMGAIIGTMVICLYLPMFTIYENIQGAT